MKLPLINPAARVWSPVPSLHGTPLETPHKALLDALRGKPGFNPFARSGFTEKTLGEKAGFWTEETTKSGRRKIDRRKTRDLLNTLLAQGLITKGHKERTLQAGSQYILTYHIAE